MYIQQGIDTNPTRVSLTDRLMINVLVTVLNFRLTQKEVSTSPFPVMIVIINKQYNTVMMVSSGSFILAKASEVEFVLPVLFCRSILTVTLRLRVSVS